MSSDGIDNSRRRFLTAATTVVGGAGVVAVAVPFLASWNPSARAKSAGAPVEANIGKLEAGQQIIVKWQGKPVWIVRRDEEALASLKKIEPELSDIMSDESIQPAYAKNEHRSIKPEYLVVVGICTHLGCSPTYRPEITADWMGGFFCPCHGSKFDFAGRVFKGVPAPTNLVIPPHKFVAENVVLIGEDGEA
ncbi:MAG: ubiquinol-cytochrome c reductase iron-sulfur subunit [Gammaproteobacteria bacterium]|jgi:ubiquinol-cytochrome c reductase iron-sulfur subunit|nr:ubiquinol-cytochrome c reductase iron-sulfur subunit [Gammaproteobacteria bacterium]MBT3725048.1 ubiquinol-cytochrome c reductase iron-sulfur subunit [Gammaproteobacteria bacterium]MBT4076312.1 ubiquinol-cytochrome c reductase iron-sulfur subunit [Gammaproteobacteria bacterium]MBT4194788.1 ubiquinol-cytochrome c reductase iron-sulfur subunit [Gammaproteobacteria bacterium]MBT4450759.1 ubiquinol-cytochrome c reductase iron-sulfur subunit [Gammaproteobacteria bacterium]